MDRYLFKELNSTLLFLSHPIHCGQASPSVRTVHFKTRGKEFLIFKFFIEFLLPYFYYKFLFTHFLRTWRRLRSMVFSLLDKLFPFCFIRSTSCAILPSPIRATCASYRHLRALNQSAWKGHIDHTFLRSNFSG
mgnify:CR=1 FL=1